MEREWCDFQKYLEGLRPGDCDIISVGVRGPNYDCYDGNAIVTVRMGRDEATSEALHLVDAIALARGKILREREARKRKDGKESANG